MPSQWIVKRKEKEQGPYTSPELRQLARSGRLRTTDLIRKQGCEKFVPAEMVKGLFAAASTPPAKPERQESFLQELPVAEVVEVIDEELPIVLEAVAEDDDGSPDDFDEQNYENSYDEYPVADYVDYVEHVEYEAPASSLRRASTQNRARSSPRSGSRETRRERPASRPAKKKVKKTSDGDDDTGPWQALFYSLFSIALGIGLFIAIGPQGVEISGYGIIVWIMMLLNYIGGRWAILIFFVFCGLVGFHTTYEKFRDR